jgi:hypothetical protein
MKLSVDFFKDYPYSKNMMSNTYHLDQITETINGQTRDFEITADVTFCHIDGTEIDSVSITEWNDGENPIEHGHDETLLDLLRHHIEMAIEQDEDEPSVKELREDAKEWHQLQDA